MHSISSSEALPRRSSAALRARPLLGRRAALVLLASTALTLLASSSAPSPLYGTYQARWGFSDLTVTVIFGVYALAVLASLLVFGSLSDHIGRRPPLVAALLAQAGVMIVFAFAGNLDVLLAARVLQGLATGAALGAIGAGLVDLDADRGPVVNTSALMAGTATGSLVSALFVQLLPAPTELIYLALSGLFLVQAVGATMIAETSAQIAGAWRSLRPTLALPTDVRRPLLLAAPTLVAVWMLGGFYLSLGPSLAQSVAGDHSLVLAGAAPFLLAGSGTVMVLRFHRIRAQRFALIGAVAVIVGTALLLWGVAARSLPIFALGTFPAGAGFGAGFQGGLRTIVANAKPHERAGVISVVYVVSYLSLGLPAILAGALAVDSTLPQAAEELGAGVIVLATLTAATLGWAEFRVLRERRRAVACPVAG